jgi:hypothetical protein
MLLTIIFLIAAALRGYGLGLYYGCRYAVRHGPQIMDRRPPRVSSAPMSGARSTRLGTSGIGRSRWRRSAPPSATMRLDKARRARRSWSGALAIE